MDDYKLINLLKNHCVSLKWRGIFTGKLILSFSITLLRVRASEWIEPIYSPKIPRKKIIIENPKEIRINIGDKPSSNEFQYRIFKTRYTKPIQNENAENANPIIVAILMGILELLINPTTA